jgi:hypothetical protein
MRDDQDHRARRRRKHERINIYPCSFTRYLKPTKFIMKSSILLSLCAGAVGVLAASASIPPYSPSCKSNNCARAVVGSHAKLHGQQQRRKECSEYMTTTVYVNSAEVPVSTGKAKAVPRFASDSCGKNPSTAFSSACSCWGITTGTTTTTAKVK